MVEHSEETQWALYKIPLSDLIYKKNLIMEHYFTYYYLL